MQTMHRLNSSRLGPWADAQVPGGQPNFNQEGDVCAGDEQHCAYEEQGDGTRET